MMHGVPKTILIVNIRLIGDVILTTPLIGLLREAFPDSAIDLLVNRGSGEFLEKDPRVRTVLYHDGGEIGPKQGKSRYLRQIFRRYELAINMNASDRGCFAALLAGARWRSGLYYGNRFWSDIWKRLFFSHPVKYPFPIHYARLCQVIAEKLGMPVRGLKARVFWDDEDRRIVAKLLEDKGVPGPYFVMHPFARWRYKYWQLEKFAIVSDAVAERFTMQPIWTSSPEPSEKTALAQAASLCRIQPVLIPGELNLTQMVYLLSQASLYVGLDTAISHLAATTGIPLIALYGPTIADWWSPWNNDGPITQQCPLPRGKQRTGNIIVIQSERPCVPCGRSGCDDRGEESPCLLEIDSADVLVAVEELLGHHHDRGGKIGT